MSPCLQLTDVHFSVDSSFIHVKVGKNEDTRTFGVHETLLRRQSKFFQSALSGDWLESKTRTIELPEQTPAAFDLYFGWLYNRKIHSKKQDNYEGHEAELLQVAEAYCLAEMIGDGDFADAVMDTLLVCAAEYNTCPFKHANNLYEKLSQGSPLRRLVLEMWVYERRSKWRDTAMNLSEEVLRDIVLAIVEMKGPTTVEAATAPYKNGDRCAYHQHKKAVQLCYLTKHNSKRH